MRALSHSPRATRRAFLVTLAGLLATGPRAGRAQPAARVARIGYLSPSLAAAPGNHQAFVRGLLDLGYVEGRDVVIEYRDAAGRSERFPALAAELVAARVDVIVAPTTLGALAARGATRAVPIVFATAGDPVSSGLVTSLARPGGNATGLSIIAPELVAKRLELLTLVVPGVSRVAILWQPGAMGERMDADMLKEADVAVRALGLRLLRVEAREPADLERAFAEMARGRAGAVSVLGSTMFSNERRRLVELTARARLPAVYTSREFVEAGDLMAYGPNVAEMYRRAAGYVDRILKGAVPAELPVEQASKFELLINLRTARTLGLTIPPSLLQRADQVIE